MDPKVNQLLQEIVRLTDNLRREAEECQGYARNNDKSSTLRNLNDNRDELATLNNKWQELTNLLNR